MSAEQRESPLFRGWARFVIKSRWLVLAICLAITAFFAYQSKTKLRFDSSVEYFAAGSEAHDLLMEFQEDFGNDTYHVVLVQGDVFTVEFLERLQGLHTALEGFDVNAEGIAGPGEITPAVDGGSDGFDDWGDGNDEAGFGGSSGSDKPAAPADDFDDWGDGNDDAGFGGDAEPEEAAEPGEGTGGGEAEAHPAAGGEQAGGDMVEDVTSLVNVRQTVFEGGAVRVRGLLENGIPAASEMDALEASVLGDPTLSGYVVGADAHHAAIMLRTTSLDFEGRSRTYQQLKAAVRSHDAEGFRLSVSGMPALNSELVTTMQADMRRLIAAAFVVMALVLGFLFRNVVGVIAPLVVVAMAAIWTLGSMAFFHVPVTLLTNIVPAFLACVGLGDSIHVQAVYRDTRQKGMGRDEALISTVGSTGMPILFTTLTTAVGLLSFRFAKMEAIAEMGSFAAFGVMVALFLSVTVLPIVLSFGKDAPVGAAKGAPASDGAPGERDRDWVDGLLGWATSLSERRSAPVILVGAVLLVVAAVGIARITVYHNPVDWLAEDYPARVELDRMDEHIGGTAQVNVVVETTSERGLRDLELLRGMEKLEQHIRDFEHPETGQRIVTGTASLLDIVKETNRALHGGDQAFYALPETQRGVSDNLFLFENASPKDLQRLATTDLAKSHITVRLHWMDATSYTPFTEWVEEGIERYIGDKAIARPTGSVYELVTTVGGLIDDLVRSFTAALVSVTLMMVLLLRSPKLGVIAMIPNLVPVALVMGFMGFASIPMDLTNLLIASIIIGVAVDNTVHYMFQWKAAYYDDAGMEGSIRYALEHAGRALVGTGMILALGFGVYLTSSMVNIRRFGMLVGSACVFALFTNLIFAPALLRSIFGRDQKTGD